MRRERQRETERQRDTETERYREQPGHLSDDEKDISLERRQVKDREVVEDRVVWIDHSL
jgi:hypothetical protein